MFKFIAPAALLAASTLAASAQDAATFAGVYGGLSFGYADLQSNTPVDPGASTSVEAFLGYNHALGQNLIVGAELAYGGAAQHSIPAGTLAIDNSFSARLRTGYAFDRSMVYATVGYVAADTSISAAPPGFELSGPTFGLGFEQMLSDNLSARIEYTHGDFDLSNGVAGVGVSSDRVSVGLAMHF
ncbi:outer membrane beta-barrel protein [Rhodobacterales bacterium HKCCE3408]|nr:outer membrane beta-barrel protein [Rhodobacterales bacterium HKCCE3408]